MAKKKRDWGRVDPDIEYSGSKITLPDDPDKMPIKAAIEALQRKDAAEQRVMDVYEVIDAYPEDALVALHKAMTRKFGWVDTTGTKGFFGEVPPKLITIQTGLNESVQVPVGEFTLPNVENPITVEARPGEDGPVLVIHGSVRKREATVVKELAELTREILRTESIYKGKAIRVRTDEEGHMHMNRSPEFIDTSGVNADMLVLNDVEYDLVATSLWAPIRHTETCIKHKIPLNRGVLLEGTYGTGKTMTAQVTAQVCEEHGWTFILLDDVRGLKDALMFAKRYQPAVVFSEDVDRVADKRDQRGNDLLNTIDGVLTKNSMVITVLTTNHVERLNKAMLRPGRLDAVISVLPPDAKSVERLIRQYGAGLVAEDEDLTEVSEFLQGNIPATIREVVERSKLSMINNGREQVTAQDLLISAHGMETHLRLLRDTPPAESTEETLGRVFGRVVHEYTNGKGELLAAAE